MSTHSVENNNHHNPLEGTSGAGAPPSHKDQILMDKLVSDYLQICVGFLNTVAQAAKESAKETAEHVKASRSAAKEGAAASEAIAEDAPKAPHVKSVTVSGGTSQPTSISGGAVSTGAAGQPSGGTTGGATVAPSSGAK